MKKLITIISLLILAGTVSASLVGSWNLNGNFNNDLGGKSALVLHGSSSTSFITDTIAGSSAQVLSFPAFPGGYTDYVGMPNDSGLNTCTNYTLVMDVKFPTLASYSCLWDYGNVTADGDFFVHLNGIGVLGAYSGTFNDDTWYRIAVVCSYDGANIDMRKYIDGTFVGAQDDLDAARFSVYNELRLFVDNDGETAAGLMNSLAFWDETKDDAFISSLGAASASGIAVPEPASIILILAALAGLLIRK